MTPPDSAEENMTNSGTMGPGDRLQAARIENGMSIEDIAMRMHLSVGILKSIEENNFDDITAPIFVKGYLRAYARIVSLSEDEMIEQYLNYYSDEDPPISPTSHLSPEISPDDARVKWTTFLVIVGLLGFLAFWWWNQYQAKTDVVSLDAEQTETMQQADVSSDILTSEIQVVEDTPVDQVAEVDVSLLTVDEPEVTEAKKAVETPEPVIPDQVEPETTDAFDQTAAMELSAEMERETVQQEVSATEPEAPPRAEVSRIAPLGGTEQLDIVILADTWVDIKDANGHQLVYELLRADQEINLIGSAPFSVFLGNAYGVNLIYQNETIDISSRIRNDNTARVTVGS
jgi:cytoskeleton protein RodZ